MKRISVLFILFVFLFLGCRQEKQAQVEQPKEQPEQKSEAEESPKPVSQEPIVREKNPVVVMETNLGTIELELFWKETPKTAENFLRLVLSGFYDSLTFHRIVPNFVIQGGDPLGNGTGGPGYTIPFEKADTKHLRGSLGMARSQDPNSAGSQFYICLRDLPQLDGKYVVFGKVIKGMDVVDKIAQVPTGPGDRPKEKVIMTRVYEKTE